MGEVRVVGGGLDAAHLVEDGREGFIVRECRDHREEGERVQWMSQ